MIRFLLVAAFAISAGSLAAQTASVEANSDAEDSVEAIEGQNVAAEAGVGAATNQTARPDPALPRGVEDLADPDPSAFDDAQARPLLADRQPPSDYPRLDARDSEGGPLDGAEVEEALKGIEENAEVGAIVATLARRDCRVAQDEVAQVFGREGFDPETVTRTLAALYVQGIASLDARGTLSLPASVCPPSTPTASPRDRVLAAFRDGGCDIEESALRELDLPERQLRSIIAGMVEAGEVEIAEFSSTGRRAGLRPDLCEN